MYDSIPESDFTGGVGDVIILSCVTNRTYCVCVTCTYSGVDMHPGNSHHTLMFHKYYGKHTSEQCKVTDRVGMETYIRCSHGCIYHDTVNIFLSFRPSSLYYHYICHGIIDHVTGKTQARPFEDESYGCNQRGANLCGANARPTDELSLARGGGGEQRSWSGVLKEGTTKAILKACQGVGGEGFVSIGDEWIECSCKGACP